MATTGFTAATDDPKVARGTLQTNVSAFNDVVTLLKSGEVGYVLVSPGGGGESFFTSFGLDKLIDAKAEGTNVFIGALAGNANTGYWNTAVGYQALQDHTTGNGNTAVGFAALVVNTTGYFNTAVGHESLKANTTKGELTAIGYQALKSNTTGENNTAIGYQALTANTSGIYNTSVGYKALTTNTNGAYNTAVGWGSLIANTTGLNNSAFGFRALGSNTTGGDNTAVGLRAADSNTTGNFNVALGDAALQENTTGSKNVAVGYEALNANTTIGNLTAIGYQALKANLTGQNNTAIGYNALTANTSGYSDTAVGWSALASNTTGIENTSLGFRALFANTVGSSNTALGYRAAESTTTGSYNICIGAEIDTISPTADGQITIGNAFFATGATTIGIIINNAMKAGVGTNAPAARLDVDTGTGDNLALRVDRAGDIHTESIAEFVSNFVTSNTVQCRIMVNGDIANTNNVYEGISDEKLKQNVQPATPKLEKLLQILVRKYEFKNNPGFDQIGVIAQEIETIFPGLVKDVPDYANLPDPDWVPEPEKTIQEPIFEDEVLKETRQTIEIIDGKHTIVETIEEKTRKIPVFDEYPLHDKDGNAMLNSDGDPVMHRIQRVVDVVIPAQTESDRPLKNQPTGTVTKSVKYSVFVPMIIKAIQELATEVRGLQV